MGPSDWCPCQDGAPKPLWLNKIYFSFPKSQYLIALTHFLENISSISSHPSYYAHATFGGKCQEWKGETLRQLGASLCAPTRKSRTYSPESLRKWERVPSFLLDFLRIVQSRDESTLTPDGRIAAVATIECCVHCAMSFLCRIHNGPRKLQGARALCAPSRIYSEDSPDKVCGNGSECYLSHWTFFVA